MFQELEAAPLIARCIVETRYDGCLHTLVGELKQGSQTCCLSASLVLSQNWVRTCVQTQRSSLDIDNYW